MSQITRIMHKVVVMQDHTVEYDNGDMRFSEALELFVVYEGTDKAEADRLYAELRVEYDKLNTHESHPKTIPNS